jgi:hypothetical protein
LPARHLVVALCLIMLVISSSGTLVMLVFVRLPWQNYELSSKALIL